YNTGPSEVNNVLITNTISTSNLTGIELHISWNPNFDPYLPLPSKYFITLTENGNLNSLPIEIFSGNSKIINVFQTVSGQRAIQPKTNYLINVQAVTSDGLLNKGT